MKISYYLSFFFILIVGLAEAQKTTVRGRVVDAKKGEGVSFAAISFANTTEGVTTDLDGSFELTSNLPGLKAIEVSYVGYETLVLPIQSGQTQIMNIKFKEVGLVVGQDIIVIGQRLANKDTAAIRLYRRVVANKDQNRPENYDSYAYAKYVKTQFDIFNIKKGFKDNKLIKKFDFVLENLDTLPDGRVFLPAMIRETASDVWFRKDKGTKEIVKGEVFSGISNTSIGELVDYTFDDIKIYDNTISISGKTFISPFANGALASYNYYIGDTLVTLNGRRYSFLNDDKLLVKDNKWKRYLLKDTAVMNKDGVLEWRKDSISVRGDTLVKLDFGGKRRQDLCFTGTSMIDLRNAAIQFVSLQIGGEVNLNYVNDFGIKQTFSLVQNKWFKTKEEFLVSLNPFKTKDGGSVRIIKTSIKDKVKLGIPLEDKIFEGEAFVIPDSATNIAHSKFTALRPEGLSGSERKIYKMVDSVQSTSTYKNLYWLGYLGTTAYANFKYFELGRIYKFFSWNQIEGIRLRFGGRTTLKFSKRVLFEGYTAYGLSDKEWKYAGTASVMLPTKNNRWNMLTGGYKYDLSQLNQADVLLSHDNLMISLLRPPKQPLGRLLKEQIAYLTWEKEWFNGFYTYMTPQNRTMYPIPGLFDFQKDGITINSITMTEFKFRARYTKNKFLTAMFWQLPVTFNRPTFTFDLVSGVKNVLKGEYNYAKVDISLAQRLQGAIGYTNYNLFVGKVFGNIPYPFLEIHRGNESLIHNRFSYNLMREFEYVSDEYAGIWLDHHFDGLILNQIPLLKKLKLRELVYFRGVMGRVTPGALSVLDLPEAINSQIKTTSLNNDVDQTGKPWANSVKIGDYGVYMEAGFGIENIINLFRVDFLWRLTQTDKPEINNWGIRVALQPKF